MTALLLLAPGTPMLFQGQEFAAPRRSSTSPTIKPELAKLVARAGASSWHSFRSLARPANASDLRRSRRPATFDVCKLDFAERQKHQPSL